MSATIIRHPLFKESPIPAPKDEFRDSVVNETGKLWRQWESEKPTKLVEKVQLLEAASPARARVLHDLVDQWLEIVPLESVELPAHSCELTEGEFVKLAAIGREENFRGYMTEVELYRSQTPLFCADHLESRIYKVFVLAHPNKPWALPTEMERAAARNLRFLKEGKIPRLFHRELVEELEAQLRFAEVVKRPKGGDRIIFEKVRKLREKVFA